MRPPGLTANRIAKRYIIVGALLAGIKIATHARQLGISRSWASREANAPGTRLLIAALFAPHRERLSRLFGRMLDLIDGAFQARKIFLVKGAIVDGGPITTRDSKRGAVSSAGFFTEVAGKQFVARPGPDRGLAARCSRGQRGRRRVAARAIRIRDPSSALPHPCLPA
jgi:hypothetical protein